MLNAAAFLSTLPILFEWAFATNNFAYKEPLMNTDAMNNAIAPLQDTVKAIYLSVDDLKVAASILYNASNVLNQMPHRVRLNTPQR